MSDRKEYQRNWVANRRLSYINGRGCSICNSKEKLQFHHRDLYIKTSHRIFSWTKVRLEAELEKCDLLCLKCHKLEHTVLGKIHGTLQCYRISKCRCDICRDAKRKSRIKLNMYETCNVVSDSGSTPLASTNNT